MGKKIKEVEQITDLCGEKVDEKMKEIVAALNLLGIPTSASCEGHLEHGFNVPWIEISAPNEPNEKYIGQNEVIQRVADEKGIPFEEVKRMIDVKSWRKSYIEYSKHKTTPEYKKWKEENKRLKREVTHLLNEFYQREEPSISSARLKTLGGDSFRIEPAGIKEDWEDPEKRKRFSKKRKEQAEERLLAYQQEMIAFGIFLKNRFFGEQSAAKSEKPETKENPIIDSEFVKKV